MKGKTEIKQMWNYHDKQVSQYTEKLLSYGVLVRKTNSVFISGVGKKERVRVKLDRKNTPLLSDKIRDLHQILKAIELSENWNVTIEDVLTLMDKNGSDPLQVHHEKNTLIYDVMVMSASEHDQYHRQQVLKAIRGN